MPEGGTPTLETSNVMIDQDFARRYGEGEPRPLCDDHRHRYRLRHSGGDPRAGVRSVLHHQGSRQGHRAGLGMVYGFIKQSGGHITLYSEVDHWHRVPHLPAAREILKCRCWHRTSHPPPAICAATKRS
ncbi:MAG: hypothetical protein MZV49_15765 [Rhodopseudomonas palustris]|nr:hypothetical protein [Rhodopseudomonas palustris]